ncbi:MULTISPECIES: anti-sigma factor family protein [unclassified Luteococcus]|uniref:anti-sigma factor family protein n=1 Tax=unclassified Luteococcus TaxID=2639923 RepID=UPI00313C49B3
MTCADCREELTAYADQALPDHERERVAAHLVGCDGCRAELAGINELRSLLTRCTRQSAPTAPGHLADRLVAIAGAEADRQLWLAPERSGCLPSPRRRRRIRVLALGSMTTAGILGALGSAWLMAPTLPPVSDPEAGSITLTENSRADGAGNLLGPQTSAAVVSTVPVVDVEQEEGQDCPEPFACPDALTGLPRTELDLSGAPGLVRTDYAAQGQQVTVVQQHGWLAGQPDRVAGEFRQAWQSGETVYCVVASDETVGRAAVAQLPHEQAVADDAVQRVRTGLRALVGERGR